MSDAPQRARSLGHRVGRPLAALATGLILLGAFPPFGSQWWLAPIGVAAFTLTLRGTTLGRAALLGTITGLAFFAPMLYWVTLLGYDVWALLTIGEVLFFAAFGVATALVLRLPAGWVWLPALWVAQEAARDRFPFGGFPWGRLAWVGPDSPIGPLAGFVGAAGMTAVFAAVGTALAFCCWRLVAQLPGGWGALGRMVSVWVTVAVTVLALAAASLLTAPTRGQGDPAYAQIALVQGNTPRIGLDAYAQRAAVLDNHVSETLRLAADVDAGRTPRPELVIWPESSTDIDPLTDPQAAAAISEAASAIGVPILVGATINADRPGYYRNAGIVWDPVTGPQPQMYFKQHLVPFGEYVPFRSLVMKIFTRLEQVGGDKLPGHSPGVLQVGPVRLGDVICFEVAFDAIPRHTVAAGARVLVIQTNNASYRKAQTVQQLQMGRARAIEHGRSVLVAATSGISAVIRPDGRVADDQGWFTKGYLNDRVALRDHRTVADKIGGGLEWALTIVGGASIGAALIMRRRRRT